MRLLKPVKPVFRRALDCFETRSEFALQVGQTRQVVNYWVRIGYVPTEHALEVSRATGSKVSVLELLNEANRERMKVVALREQRKALAVEDPVEGAG